MISFLVSDEMHTTRSIEKAIEYAELQKFQYIFAPQVEAIQKADMAVKIFSRR